MTTTVPIEQSEGTQVTEATEPTPALTEPQRDEIKRAVRDYTDAHGTLRVARFSANAGNTQMYSEQADAAWATLQQKLNVGSDITPTVGVGLTAPQQEAVMDAARAYANAKGDYMRAVANLTADQEALYNTLNVKWAELHTLLTQLRAHDSTDNLVTGLTAERDAARHERDIAVTYSREANASREQVTTELAQFKERVAEVATRYAVRHDMCSVVDDALEELGLERKPKSYRGQLVITVNFEATMGSGFRELPAESWVLDSIGDRSALRNAIEEAVEFDSDHDSGVVNGIEFAVSNIRDAD